MQRGAWHQERKKEMVYAPPDYTRGSSERTRQRTREPLLLVFRGSSPNLKSANDRHKRRNPLTNNNPFA
jgi:hypothetical protein